MIAYEDALGWIHGYAAVVAENKTYLTQLDSAIGDADHGINMDRGFQAVLARLEGFEGHDIGAMLKAVGMTLISKVGGAAGPLYGTFFLQLGTVTAGKEAIDLGEFVAALEAAIAGIQRLGKAEPGDKTMVDALLPARDAIRAAAADGASVGAAVAKAAEAAQAGMLATIPLVARRGRASYLGERSAGHQDPGATSSYLLLKCAAETWSGN